MAVRFRDDQILSNSVNSVGDAWINGHICQLFAYRLFVLYFRFTRNERKKFRRNFKNAGRINVLSLQSEDTTNFLRSQRSHE